MKNKDYITTDEITYNMLVGKIEQLENNRDKAIEEMKYLISNCDISDYQGKKIMNILKGDSDD